MENYSIYFNFFKERFTGHLDYLIFEKYQYCNSLGFREIPVLYISWFS